MPTTRQHATARRLRRDGTETERRLWRALRSGTLGVKFRRQHPIPPYIADFACIEAALVIEVDGGGHGPERDVPRDAAMRAAGWHVRRYWNSEVTGNLDGVLADIARVLAERMTSNRRRPSQRLAALTPALSRATGEGDSRAPIPSPVAREREGPASRSDVGG